MKDVCCWQRQDSGIPQCKRARVEVLFRQLWGNRASGLGKEFHNVRWNGMPLVCQLPCGVNL